MSVFEPLSFLENLAALPPLGLFHIFVHDRVTGTTRAVTLHRITGKPAGGGFIGTVTADGRWAILSSFSSDHVAGDTNNSLDVFVHAPCPPGASALYGNGWPGTLGTPTIGVDNALCGLELYLQAVTGPGCVRGLGVHPRSETQRLGSSRSAPTQIPVTAPEPFDGLVP